MSVRSFVEAVEGALRTVPGLRVYRDLGATFDPPAAVLGAPALTWAGPPAAQPTGITLPVFVVVTANDRALETLWELVPRVSAVIEELLEANVMRADPAVIPSGNTELPGYEITVEGAP